MQLSYNVHSHCCDIAIESMKSILPRKPVHKSMSSKRLKHASVRILSIKSNAGVSVSRISACVNLSSSVSRIQKYSGQFFSDSFNIWILF